MALVEIIAAAKREGIDRISAAPPSVEFIDLLRGYRDYDFPPPTPDPFDWVRLKNWIAMEQKYARNAGRPMVQYGVYRQIQKLHRDLYGREAGLTHGGYGLAFIQMFLRQGRQALESDVATYGALAKPVHQSLDTIWRVRADEDDTLYKRLIRGRRRKSPLPVPKWIRRHVHRRFSQLSCDEVEPTSK